MIITLTKADFSSCKIGTLTTFNVRKSTVIGATVNISLSSVERAGYSSATTIATIFLDELSYEGHAIKVMMGSTDVSSWYSSGKVTIPANTPITSNITISVTATAVSGGSEPSTPTMYTFTINPTPTTATVTLTASGYSQSGNAITVPSGTSVSWTVSADGYYDKNGSETVTKDKTLNVILIEVVNPGDMYTYTVNPTPKVATVTLSAPRCTQSGNAITVPSGTSVSWTVESLGYTKQEGIETITGDKSSDIELTSADATQPVLTVYSTPSGKTIWTPTGGQKVSSNETGTFVGNTVGMRCYWGVTKDGYEPHGDVVQLNSNVNKEATLTAIPIVEVERELVLDTDMTRITGYFVTSGGAWQGYYANFCFHQIPVQPGQSYKITTTTGQNAYPAIFCTSTLDLNSIDLTEKPGGNTLTKYSVKSSKKYGGPPAFGVYVVTVPEDTTCMLVNCGTATSALNSFKVELLK